MSFPIRRPRGLLARFLLILMPLFVALAIPGIGLLVHYSLEVDQDVLAARFGNHAGRVAAALARHDAAAVPGLAQDLLSSLAADRALVCAELRPLDGTPAQDAPVAALPPRIGCRFGEQGESLSLPVGESGRYRLLLRFSDAELREAAAVERNLALSVIALAFVIALATSALGFRFIVGRPLRLLLAAIEEATATGRRRRIRGGGRDELGRVIEAFNELQQRDVERENALRAVNRQLEESRQALRRLNADLEERVAERTAELATRTEEAEAANRAKARFLATMSHELRTPLSAIIGFAEVLGRDAVLEPARRADYLEEIAAGGRQLLGMVNDLLDMARIDGGRLQLDEQEVELGEALGASVRQVRAQAEARGLSLALQPPPAPLSVLVDPRGLRQILLKLLSNAVKFTPPGGHVEVTAGRRADGAVEIVVADDGCGIAEEQLDAVLQPFGQGGDGSRTDGWLARPHEGTGLGLPLAKALAELHGGSLSLRSSQTQGTTVLVTLPAWRLRPLEAEASALADSA